MIIKRIELKNFKKHTSKVFDFTPGSNLIVGPNYAGKSSIMEAILIGLFGNSVAPGAAAELVSDGQKDFLVRLCLSGHTIERSLKNSSLSRDGEEPYARGHSAVNKAVTELLGISKDVFLKVFASEQGAPQKLLDMEGAELQRFIEGVIGIDQLDAVLKECNRRISDLKSKTEALDYMVLPSETAIELEKKGELIESALRRDRARLDEMLTADAATTGLVMTKELELKEAREGNAAIEKYRTDYERLTAQLNGRDLLPVPDIRNLQEMEYTTKRALQDSEAKLEQQRLTNEAFQRYYERMDMLNQELFELPDEVDLTDLEAQIESLRYELSQSQQVERDYQAHLKEIAKWEATLAKAIEAKEKLPDNIYVTGEYLDQVKAEAAAAYTQWEAAKRAVHESICPTCHRAMEGVHPADMLNQEMEAKRSYESLAESAKRFSELRKVSILSDELNEQMLEATVKLHELRHQAWLAVRPSVDVAAYLKEKQTEYNDARFNSNKRADIENRLRRMVQPEGKVEELWSVDALRESYIAARTLRNQAEIEQQQVLTHNKEVESLLRQLDSLDKPDLKHIALEPIEQLLATYRNDLAAIHKEASDLRIVIHGLELDLVPLKQQLSQHYEAFGKCLGFYDQIDNYRYISQILTNSRAGFISKAMATIFSVATEFCKLSTNGDIESVLFDAGIKYCESGVVRTKQAASGAQKSLIGLGMKLGIANLVTTPFGSLLLDEAGAAMSDDISLQASLAMASLCEQSISISHRKLDVAGNVIEL